MFRRPIRSTMNAASGSSGVAPVLHTLVSSVTCYRCWQADYLVTSSGGAVSSWQDNKNNVAATQATGSKQPTLATGVNGRPCITFDGVDDILVESTINMPPPGTTPAFIYGAFTQKSWTASDAVWSAGSVGGLMQLASVTSSPNMATFCGTLSSLNAGAPIGTAVRSMQKFGNTTADYLKLGSTNVTGVNLGNGDANNGWNLGAATGTTNFGNFDIYVCMLFNGEPSGAELTALDAAITSWYGGSVSV